MTKQSGKSKRPLPGRLRIVAGIWRSRLLDIAAVEGLRPTSERVRETLFNWLSPRIAGSRCLDLYAGTGALGLEALSRGAAESVFVEKSATAVAALRRNIATLGAETGVVHHAEALQYLKGGNSGRFDVVFLDPPFAAGNLEELCKLLDEQSLLAKNARIYLEQDRTQELPVLPPGWETLKIKTAGNVRYSLARSGAAGATK